MKENIKMNSKEAKDITGGLTATSKMPCPSYSLPAQACKMGSKLVSIKGSVCEGCYALKGFYRFKQGRNARDVRLASIYNPKWVSAMSFLVKNRKDNAFFRWHDSGDIQSERHLDMMCEIARATPDVKHWLPTKEVATVRKYLKTHDIPKNLNVRISAYKINGKPVRLKGCTTSMVVTKVGDDKRTSNFDCPIYADSSHGKSCGDCTACYDRLITNVTYLKH